ncbi:MAG: hypothetical protein PVI23_10545 [Maricaulaceae bacterium]|jgi:hypothetical protein
MTAAALQADCTRCAALCCVAPAFDRSEDFGVDKPAATPCPHLAPDHRCAIHAERARAGFKGCIGYDCLGAGQRVTQEIFGGRSWREDASLLVPMSEAFGVVRRIHELRAMLEKAGEAQLSENERDGLRALCDALEPVDGWSRETLAAADIDALEQRVRAFLRTLRRHFTPAR